jgi:hypothetical protein
MLQYQCPYTPGAEFVLLLTPPAYLWRNTTAATQSLPLRIRVQVLQSLSFTRSQTMKVAVISKPEGDDLIPSTALLKLYDRRYLEERNGSDVISEDVWNPQKEEEAERIAKEKNKITEEPVTGQSESEEDESPIDEEMAMFEMEAVEDTDPRLFKRTWEFVDDVSSDEDNQWDIEERYRSMTKSWFKTEVSAYDRLQALQGSCVPIFYGTVTFDAMSLTEMSPGIILEVKGIILQFIEGKRLDEITIDSLIAIDHPQLSQAVVQCFESIIPLGILHGDVRLANVLIRDSDSQVFLIDFGLAILRKSNVSEEWWNRRATAEGEARFMKELLYRKRLWGCGPLAEPLNHPG